MPTELAGTSAQVTVNSVTVTMPDGLYVCGTGGRHSAFQHAYR